MQALCGRCNARKGASVTLRSFQAELDEACQRIADGSRSARQIILSVTPGGGKQAAAVITAARLIPSVADAFCWVVPRLSLQRQAEEAFQSTYFRELLGHRQSIRQSTSEIDPCRGLTGFVTTYQSLPSSIALPDEFRRKRYVLFLDEPHHVADDRAWREALVPLVERAAVVVLASGTLRRHDGGSIAFLPYYEKVEGEWVPDLRGDAKTIAIQYSRREALQEHAIKPLQFHFQDVTGRWLDTTGVERHVERLSQAQKDDARHGLWTALKTEAADGILAAGIGDWQQYRTVNPRAKVLIVVHGQAEARRVVQALQRRGIERVGVAVSDDGAKAEAEIVRFKRHAPDMDRLDALVTVQMAYEGMDCPTVTHLICLTHIRSHPWIEQMLARAARVDAAGPPYEQQRGYCYGPDDPMLRAICAEIVEEQTAVVREREERDMQEGSTFDRAPFSEREETVPLSSDVIGERITDMSDGESTAYGDDEQLIAIAREIGAAWLPPNIVRQLVQRGRESAEVEQLGFFQSMPQQQSVPTAAKPVSDGLPPSVREKQLRDSIKSFVNSYCRRTGVEVWTVNANIKQQFGPRENMTLAELERLWVWVQRELRSTVSR